MELGSIRAMVFFGHDGLDELTTVDSSTVLTVQDGAVGRQVVDPVELGLGRATPDDLRGGDAVHNAEIVRTILAGEPGPRRDVVLLNAASALQIAGTATSWASGIEVAAAAIDSGKAAAVLDQWIAVSNDARAGAH